MRYGHRAAHRKLIAWVALVIVLILWQAWSMAVHRPVPAPLELDTGPSVTAAWSGSWDTADGPVPFTIARAAPTGPHRITVPPAPGLDPLAEPGVLLVLASGSVVPIGSLGPGRSSLDLPPEATSGGRLILIDLARDLRVGTTELPPSSSWTGSAR